MLGYLCAYYRYHHPLEFITSFLNNAANEDDIRNGTAYASRAGISVTMPKWGISRGDYSFDIRRNIISKGLASVKYLSTSVAESLYQISKKKSYKRFVDVLFAIDKETSVDRGQLDILIKIDYFSDFGNQNELLRIADLFYNTFKRGQAKKVSKDVIDGTPLEPIVSKYSIGVTVSGGVAKSYTLLDIESILRELEDAIKSMHLDDLSDTLKVKNFESSMGYSGYVSGKEEDRRKLYVMDVFPVCRKKDGKRFGYSIKTKSIGSGKEARFTVFEWVFNKDPINKGDIIYCKFYTRNGEYFELTSYEKII